MSDLMFAIAALFIGVGCLMATGAIAYLVFQEALATRAQRLSRKVGWRPKGG